MAEEKKIKPTRKKVTVKSTTTKRPTKRKVVRKVSARPKAKAKIKRERTAVAIEELVPVTVTMAPNLETVLPTPLHVEPSHMIAPPRKTKVAPHRWSLRHNFVTIMTLLFVGTLALGLVAGYADITFSLINVYGTQTSSNMQPLATTERAFPTVAGNLTMTFPDRWEMTEATEDTIHWVLTDHPEQQVTLHVDTTDSDNVFNWLQTQQPTYRNAQVVAPTEAVENLRGIMVEADGTENQFIEAVYFPHQKDLADKYIVSLTVSVPADDELLSRSLADFNVFVNNLHLE